jgi:hypothetical protein
MGVDFGTSCTKVVIRTPLRARGRAVAVPLGSGTRSPSPYLLPTVLYQAPDGGLSFNPDQMPVVDLKRELLATPVPVGAIARCAAYLALVVREARGWFIQQEKEAVAGLKLDWTFHLGYPSASLKGDELREIFHATALAAWDLAQGAEAIHRDRALDAAKRSLRGELRSGANIDAIPEVLAEVAGYARSPQRQLGLHFLMDVGAGTTDLCGFILFEGAEDGDNRYTPLTTGCTR